MDERELRLRAIRNRLAFEEIVRSIFLLLLWAVIALRWDLSLPRTGGPSPDFSLYLLRLPASFPSGPIM